MDLRPVLTAALLVGGMGLVFGALLAIVGQIFRVEEDPKKAEVRGCLPGANCGGCGYAGCDAYAEQVASGKAAVDRCPVGGDAVAQKIAEAMGVEVGRQEKRIATVRCRGSLGHCQLRFEYDGPEDCRGAALVAGGDKACEYSCLGYGDCVAACPFGAVHVVEGRLAEVDAGKCVGCGVCITACPRGVLQLVAASQPVHSTCSAHLGGKVVRDACDAGCIGCGKCGRACKFGAVRMVDSLPEFDFAKCRGCMQCVDACPTGAIMASDGMRRHAVIDYTGCTGCGGCQAACPFGAIAGTGEGKRSIIEWNCTGCGLCAEACTHGCVQLVRGGALALKHPGQAAGK